MRSLKTLTRLALLGLAWALWCSEAQAVGYYVRTSGNDSNNGRSPETAFRTIQKAFNVMASGDNLIIGGGTYNEYPTFNRSGSGPQYNFNIHGDITNQAGDGTTVVVGGMKINGNFVRVLNIRFNGSLSVPGKSSDAPTVAWENANTGRMDNCEIYGGVSGVGMRVTKSKLFATETVIHDTPSVGVLVDSVIELWFAKGAIRNCGENGIRIFGATASSVVVDQSIISNNRNNGLCVEGNTRHNVVGTRTKFINNAQNGVKTGVTNGSYVNCLIANNTTNGVEVTGSNPGISFDSCTIAYNGDDGIDADKATKWNGGFWNCIIAFNNDDGIDFNNSYQGWHGNSLVFGNRDGNYDGKPAGQNDISEDPLFVSNSDLHLKNGSPAINALNSTWPNVDMDGNSRPQGARNDMGCYEGSGIAAGNYYVSTQGNDNNDGRSPGRAFRTINKAASVVAAGDKVHIAAGTYQETANFTKVGTEAAPIQFLGQGDVKWQPPGKNQWTAILNNADHTIFENIQFSGENVPRGDGWAYGLHNYYSELTFKNCEFEKMIYGSYNVYAGVKFVSCGFHDGYSHPLWAYYGGVNIDGCEFKNNEHGPLLYRNHYTLVRDSRITGSKSWSMQIGFDPYGDYKPFGTNTPTVENCIIEDNANGLILSLADKDDSIVWNRTRITKTKDFELYLHYCDLQVTPQWRAQFPIDKGGSGLLTYASKLDIRDMKLEDYANGWGLVDYYSDLSMQNVSVKRNYQGMQTYGPTKFSAKNCNFDDNKYWGFLLYNHADGAKAELSGCTMNGNSYGAHFYRSNDKNLRLTDTTIANNSSHGLYLNDCDAEFSPRTMGTRWKLSNNGYHITTYYGKTLFDNITLSDAKYWGALTYYSEVTVRNCNFT
ncbi:MAG: right-handed parallel beta-helix repeat-containing protein, partial [Planctomycetia bacterium]|nr:right-handed parallel beta-helix repeat-containing protein [Planctomycetia bacterium]